MGAPSPVSRSNGFHLGIDCPRPTVDLRVEAPWFGLDYFLNMRTRLSRFRWLDVAVVLVGVWQQAQIWSSPRAGPRVAIVPIEVAFVAALLLRDRFPLLARVGSFVSLGLWAGFLPHDRSSSASFFVGSMLAFWIAGLAAEWRPALAGWSAGILLVAYAESVFLGGGFGEFLFTMLVQTGVWIAAFVLAHRTRDARVLAADLARARVEREERTRSAVADERTRIARELHDVIAHNLTVAIIQLTAARGELAPADSAATLAAHLDSADGACRRALEEMRRLLGVLRTERDEPTLQPAPSLASLARLVDSVRAAGLSVDLTVEGTPPVADEGVALAAYRIVQEALTNALKHGDREQTRLTMRYEPRFIDIEVVNTGKGHQGPDAEPGRGLIGIRERVALYGGSVEAGPLAAGGFRVAATLPVERWDG
jgi:signal transduction histidine kinase